MFYIVLKVVLWLKAWIKRNSFCWAAMLLLIRFLMLAHEWWWFNELWRLVRFSLICNYWKRVSVILLDKLSTRFWLIVILEIMISMQPLIRFGIKFSAFKQQWLWSLWEKWTSILNNILLILVFFYLIFQYIGVLLRRHKLEHINDFRCGTKTFNQKTNLLLS